VLIVCWMAAASSEETERTALVVGATSGIGRAIAIELSHRGFAVTAVGRSQERGEELLTHLSPGKEHKFISCDASLLGSIFKFCDEFSKTRKSLDILVVTQGIGTIQGYTPTEEGIDVKLATHYYGRVAFIVSLLPLLKESKLEGGSRVLSVLAAGVHSSYKYYQDDPLLENNYSLENAANAACMYNDIAMDSLARENPSVSFIHSSPGFVNTNWGSEMPWYIRIFVRAFQPFGRRPEDCANIMSNAILSPHTPVVKDLPNFFLVDQDGKGTKKSTLHDEAREAVWTHTLQLLSSKKPQE